MDTNTPSPDSWFDRTGRIDPNDPYDHGIVPEPFNPTSENDQMVPYGENKMDETIDYSDVDFTGKTQDRENADQRNSAEKDIDVWTIYIIVGSVAGGVLLIGVVAIVVALCCNRYEDDGYKHTNV